MLVRQEEDRRTLSRELHDEIAQVLSAINFQLAILSKTSTRDAAQLQAVLNKSQQLIMTSAKTVQDFARRLRPTVLDDIGLIAAAKSYIDDLKHCSDLTITLKTQGRFHNLEEKTKTAFFRVMQEALTNVARHAHATQVKVTFKNSTSALHLVVTDNGRGFHPSKKGLGIIGMQERMSMIGGSLSIKSKLRGGTSVSATLRAKRSP